MVNLKGKDIHVHVLPTWLKLSEKLEDFTSQTNLTILPQTLLFYCLVKLDYLYPNYICYLTSLKKLTFLPPMGFSVSTGLSSVTSPSYTSLVSLIRSPMARLKFSINTSVFFISDEYTSLPTMGQKGTLLPSSWAIAKAKAVYKHNKNFTLWNINKILQYCIYFKWTLKFFTKVFN